MLYTVKYRGKDGKSGTTEIEAPNRSAVLAEAKKRGLSVISVSENHAPRKSRAPSSPSSGVLRGTIAGLIVIVLAIIAYSVMSRKTEPQPTEEKPKRQTKTSLSFTAVTNEVKEAPVVSAADLEAKRLDEERKARREMFKKMSPDERIAYLEEQAKNRPLRDKPGTNRIFRTSTEQVMDWIFRCELGNPPPLLPKLPLNERYQLVDILIAKNEILDTDSETAKEAKEVVDLAKKEFRDFIREGGDPEEFLPYYHGQLVQAHEEWKIARQSVLAAVKENADIVPEFLEKVNADLEKRGIKPVVLPPKLLERYGIVIPE